MSAALTVLTLLCAWGSAGMTCEVTQLVQLARGHTELRPLSFRGRNSPSREEPAPGLSPPGRAAARKPESPWQGRQEGAWPEQACAHGDVCAHHIHLTYTMHRHTQHTHVIHIISHTHSQTPHTDTHIIPHTCAFTCSSLRTLSMYTRSPTSHPYFHTHTLSPTRPKTRLSSHTTSSSCQAPRQPRLHL